MRLKIIVLFLYIFSFSAKAQVTLPAIHNTAYQAGDVLISGAVSFPFSRHINYDNSQQSGSQIPLSAYLDYGFTNLISGGVFGGRAKTFYRYTGNGVENQSDFVANNYIVGLRSNFHILPILENQLDADLNSGFLDTYVSVAAGFRHTRFSNIDFANENGFAGGVMLGARYYLLGGLGIFAEGGYGIFGLGNVGLTLRL